MSRKSAKREWLAEDISDEAIADVEEQRRCGPLGWTSVSICKEYFLAAAGKAGKEDGRLMVGHPLVVLPVL